MNPTDPRRQLQRKPRWQPRLKRTARAAIVLVLTLALALLTGCATLPTSGPVNTIQASGQAAIGDPNVKFDVSGPKKGQNQKEIVQGFIAAMKGLDDSLQTARLFLTDDVASTWKGNDQTLIYTGNPKVSQVQAPGSYQISLNVVSEVNSDGIMKMDPPNTVKTIKVGLVQQSDGQWRINDAPTGIFLERGVFDSLFKPVNLYFWDAAYQYLIPDVRWFSNQTTAGQNATSGGSSSATAMVRALLNGPAPYLTGAVSTAFPSGTSLIKDSVPIANGQARVDLTEKPILDVGRQAQQRMQTQLLITLQRGLNTVNQVDMRADTNSLNLDDSTPVQPSVLAPPVDDRQVGISNQSLVYLENDSLSPVSGVAKLLVEGANSPAQSYQRGNGFAFLGAGGTSLYTVSPGQSPLQRIQDIPLTPPSMSPDGRVYTAAADGSGRVFVADPGAASTPKEVDVPWLKGHTVTSLRVARDGARVVVVQDNGDSTSNVLLSGIVRVDNSSSAMPKSLQVPGVLAQSIKVSQAFWADENNVIAFEAGTDDVRPMQLSLTGTVTPLTPLTGVQKISVGDNVGSVYAQTTSGAIFERNNSIWAQVKVDGVSDLAFPG